MALTVKKTKREELTQLAQLEANAFAVNRRYFENGALPPISEEERSAYSLKALFEEKSIMLLSVYLEDEIVGGAAVKDISHNKKEIILFFIASKHQGKHLGQNALKMIEDAYPETEIWQLVTPTEVLRNAVFYVNKCGYRIIKIDAYDRSAEHGVFLFEKRKGGSS